MDPVNDHLVMSKKTDEYCCLEPDYPKTGYLVAFFLVGPTDIEDVVPISWVFRSLDEIVSGAQGMAEGLLGYERNHGLRIPDWAMIVPLTLLSTYPLQKDFWTKSKCAPIGPARFRALVEMLSEPALYKLLVLPEKYSKKDGWILVAGLPFFRTAADSVIETFMRTANFPVDQRAKSAAFYRPEQPKRLNWKTKELDDLIQSETPMKVGLVA
jgi:hypothetical protein